MCFHTVATKLECSIEEVCSKLGDWYQDKETQAKDRDILTMNLQTTADDWEERTDSDRETSKMVEPTTPSSIQRRITIVLPKRARSQCLFSNRRMSSSPWSRNESWSD